MRKIISQIIVFFLGFCLVMSSVSAYSPKIGNMDNIHSIEETNKITFLTEDGRELVISHLNVTVISYEENFFSDLKIWFMRNLFGLNVNKTETHEGNKTTITITYSYADGSFERTSTSTFINGKSYGTLQMMDFDYGGKSTYGSHCAFKSICDILSWEKPEYNPNRKRSYNIDNGFIVFNYDFDSNGIGKLNESSIGLIVNFDENLDFEDESRIKSYYTYGRVDNPKETLKEYFNLEVSENKIIGIK